MSPEDAPFPRPVPSVELVAAFFFFPETTTPTGIKMTSNSIVMPSRIPNYSQPLLPFITTYTTNRVHTEAAPASPFLWRRRWWWRTATSAPSPSQAFRGFQVLIICTVNGNPMSGLPFRPALPSRSLAKVTTSMSPFILCALRPHDPNSLSVTPPTLTPPTLTLPALPTSALSTSTFPMPTLSAPTLPTAYITSSTFSSTRPSALSPSQVPFSAPFAPYCRLDLLPFNLIIRRVVRVIPLVCQCIPRHSR